MAQVHICRLCTNICSESRSLCDANGRYTEEYELTIKFFHPTFLRVDTDVRKEFAVLCFECWNHISGFHNFQQTVLLVQAKLLEQAEEPTPVKEEEEFVSLTEVELANTHSKSQLLVTERAHQLEENTDSDVHMLTDAISVTESMESELAEEFQEPVGESNEECANIVEKPNEESSISDRTTKSSQSRSKGKTVESFDDIVAKWKPVLECEVCREPCSTFTSLGTHFKEKHPDDIFHIRCCRRKLRFQSRIREHIRVHLYPTSHKCDLCTKLLSSKIALHKHMFRIHRIDTRKASGQEAAKHRPIYKHLCDICGKSYKVPSSLREHMSIHTGERPHVCPYCPKTFGYRTSLRCHLRDEHVEHEKNSQPN